MPPPPDFASWLDRKYSILGQQAAGEYAKNIAEAGKIQSETGEVAPNAASMRALQGAQGKLLGEEATDLSVGRYPGAAALGLIHDRLYGPGSPQGPGPAPVQQPQVPQSRPGGPQIITNPFATQPKAPGPQSYLAPSSTDSFLDTNRPLASIIPSTPNLGGNDQFLRRGTSNVTPLRKGSASVRGKGGGKSAGKGGGGQGLEQILPALMAASQTSQMGGGAAGPQAADALPPPMAPGAAAPSAPGMAKGKANVMRYAEGTPDVLRRFVYGTSDDVQGMAKGKASVKGKAPPKAGGDLHRGLAAILPQLMAAMQGGGAPGGGPPMPPGGAPPQPPPEVPGMAKGTAGVMDPRSAHSAPGYPFGAGYLFGATAVPGQGSGTTDTVPAMLAPHEAVLNRAAADMMGRGRIAALNAAGVKQMGLNRGAR